MRTLGKVLLLFVGATTACSAASGSRLFGTGGSGANGTGNNGQGGETGIMFDAGSGTGGGISTGVPCNVTDPTKDMDGDGWTPQDGDCNDCDPNVNPGAVDTVTKGDGGMILGDEDCNGTPGVVPQPCDNGL